MVIWAVVVIVAAAVVGSVVWFVLPAHTSSRRPPLVWVDDEDDEPDTGVVEPSPRPVQGRAVVGLPPVDDEGDSPEARALTLEQFGTETLPTWEDPDPHTVTQAFAGLPQQIDEFEARYASADFWDTLGALPAHQPSPIIRSMPQQRAKERNPRKNKRKPPRSYPPPGRDAS